MEFIRNTLAIVHSVPFGTYAKVFGAVTLVVFGWEHYGRKNLVVYRPSTALEYCAKTSQKFFRFTGEKMAWISSYLTQIDLRDLGATVVAVTKPTWDFVTSPFYMLYGYACAAANYGNKTWLVYAGSSLLAFALLFGWYYLSTVYPKLNFWRPLYNNFFRSGIASASIEHVKKI